MPRLNFYHLWTGPLLLLKQLLLLFLLLPLVLLLLLFLLFLLPHPLFSTQKRAYFQNADLIVSACLCLSLTHMHTHTHPLLNLFSDFPLPSGLQTTALNTPYSALP